MLIELIIRIKCQIRIKWSNVIKKIAFNWDVWINGFSWTLQVHLWFNVNRAGNCMELSERTVQLKIQINTKMSWLETGWIIEKVFEWNSSNGGYEVVGIGRLGLLFTVSINYLRKHFIETSLQFIWYIDVEKFIHLWEKLDCKRRPCQSSVDIVSVCCQSCSANTSNLMGNFWRKKLFTTGTTGTLLSL